LSLELAVVDEAAAVADPVEGREDLQEVPVAQALGVDRQPQDPHKVLLRDHTPGLSVSLFEDVEYTWPFKDQRL